MNVSKIIDKTKAEYYILHDVDSKIMKQYGVDFVLSEKLQKKYKEYDIDLAVSNGNDDQTLPVPATYVIGKDGIVKYVQYDPDYKNRSNAEEILKHL
ncbi:MAG: redoxin domain-containing protein [Marinifilaceae bacterium]|nr:redoxin domain-containing protein [Marinifilaceae bacterium]